MSMIRLNSGGSRSLTKITVQKAVFLVELDKEYLAQGGVTFGGASPTLYESITPEHITLGGLVSGGTSNNYKTKVFRPTGGIALGGSSLGSVQHEHIPLGGITLGGTATTRKTAVHSPEQAVVVGGRSNTFKVKHYTSDDGATLGGSARTSIARQHVSSGGVVFGGVGLANYEKFIPRHTSLGGSLFGGSMRSYKQKRLSSNSGATLGGSSNRQKIRSYYGLGGSLVGYTGRYRVIPNVLIPHIPRRVGGSRRRYRSVFDVTQLIFQRYTESYLDDNYNLVTPEDIKIPAIGDLQPYKIRSLQQVDVPEGFTIRGGYKFSTKEVLKTLDQVEAIRADTVVINGRTFYVWREQEWSSGPLATDEYNNYVLIMKRITNEGST